MELTKKISILVPVYKSEETLESLMQRINDTLFPVYKNEYEVIFIEDCGGGKSWNIIEHLKSTYPNNIIGIKLSRNFGQHNALMCGLNYASGDIIITIDDDLQIPPEEIINLIKKHNETNADLVYGTFGDKKHNQVRNLGSWVIKRVFKIVFNAKPDATAFRLITKSLAKKLIEHKQNHVFLDGFIHWHTQNIQYQNVEHKTRQFGSSTYTVKKLLSLTFNLFFNFTVIPLRVITFLGIVFSIISFLIGLYMIYVKIYYGVPVQGYTSLATIILFTSSMMMMSMGIVGEYISRIFMSLNNKPQYSIEKKI